MNGTSENFRSPTQNSSHLTSDFLYSICAQNQLTENGSEGRELRDKEKPADTANSDAPVLNMYFDIIYSICCNKQAPAPHTEQIVSLPTAAEV